MDLFTDAGVLCQLKEGVDGFPGRRRNPRRVLKPGRIEGPVEEGCSERVPWVRSSGRLRQALSPGQWRDPSLGSQGDMMGQLAGIWTCTREPGCRWARAPELWQQSHRGGHAEHAGLRVLEG